MKAVVKVSLGKVPRVGRGEGFGPLKLIWLNATTFWTTHLVALDPPELGKFRSGLYSIGYQYPTQGGMKPVAGSIWCIASMVVRGGGFHTRSKITTLELLFSWIQCLMGRSGFGIALAGRTVDWCHVHIMFLVERLLVLGCGLWYLGVKMWRGQVRMTGRAWKGCWPGPLNFCCKKKIVIGVIHLYIQNTISFLGLKIYRSSKKQK